MRDKGAKCTSVRSFGSKSKKEEVWTRDACDTVRCLRILYLKTEVREEDARDRKERGKDKRERQTNIRAQRRRKYDY